MQQIRAEFRPREVPEGAYRLPLHVRSYEVTRSGRITPATILRYLEHLATQASADRGFDHEWYETHGSAWVVRDMRLRLGDLPGIDDHLMMATWLSDYRRVQAFREYVVWNAVTARRVARAQARWAYVDRERGHPVRIPDDLMGRFGVLGNAMRDPTLPPLPAVEGPAETFELVTREYESDTQQHTNNCVYVDWLGVALQRAVAARLPEQGYARRLPRRYQIEYIRPTVPGDALTVHTRLRPQGTRGLGVQQEITTQREGVLVLRARSLHLLLAGVRQL
jgi:acyl-CoA thioesterase FadM